MFEELSHRQKAILAIVLHNIPNGEILSLYTNSISGENYFVVSYEIENEDTLLISLPNKSNICILNTLNSNDGELISNLQKYIENSKHTISEGHTFHFKDTELLKNATHSKGVFVNVSTYPILSTLQGHHDLNNNDFIHYYVLVLSGNE